jgi:hypothetical protein
MMRSICSIFVAVLAIAWCGELAAETAALKDEVRVPEAAPPVLKLAVFKDGRVTADGKLTTMPELRTLLVKHKAKNGAVWYYREAGGEKPPPVAMEVLSAVLDTKMSIRLSSRPDYSDSIGPGGRSTGQ